MPADQAREFARIVERLDVFGVALHIGTRADGGEIVWMTPNGTMVSRMEGLPDGYRPALVLSDEHARAVLQTLSNYYGGNVRDVSELRRDYIAERGRVDKMIDALIRTAVQIGRGEV